MSSSPSKSPSNSQIFLALGLVYVLWGSTYLAIRFAIQTIPPFLMAGCRFFSAGLLLFLWGYFHDGAKPTLRHWWTTGVVGFFLLVAGNGSVVWAEQHVSSGIAALIVSTVPLWMVSFESLKSKGEKPTAQIILGLILGFSGILFLSVPRGLNVSEDISGVGVSALVFASISWAGGSIYSKTADMPASPILMTGMEMLTGGVLLFGISFFQGEIQSVKFSEISKQSWTALLYLIILGSVVGFTAYVWLLRSAPVALVSTYAYVNPVVAVFLGWLMADEIITPHMAVAASVILAAVVLITTRKKN